MPFYPGVAPSGVYVLPPHASFGPALVSHWPVLLAPPEACHQQVPAWQGERNTQECPLNDMTFILGPFSCQLVPAKE